METLIKKWKEIVIFVTIIFIISSIRVFGDNGIRPPPSLVNPVVNPASKYCSDLGYEEYVERTSEGEIGMCKFPDGSTAEEWDFVLGKAGEKWSYCTQKGYQLKTLSNNSKCASIYSPDCAVCVLSNGTEVEVTKLMSIEKLEVKCGNNVCEPNENYNNCPQDCPKIENTYIIYIIAFSTVIIIIALYVIMRKRFKTKEQYQYYKEIQ